MKVYSGDPNIFAHPQSIPDNDRDFLFNSTEDANERLIIRHEDLPDSNPEIDDTLFVCIRGKSAASFKLRVRENNHHRGIFNGIAETDTAHAGELKSYLYRGIPPHLDLNVSLSLHVISGSVPVMLAKLCSGIMPKEC